MLGRRFLILVAVLMGMTALAASVAPRQSTTSEERQAATPTPAAAGAPDCHDVEKRFIADADARSAVARATWSS